MNIYGDWFNRDIEVNNTPFNNIIIDNFLDDEYYNKIVNSLPDNITDDFWKYYNPIEVKYVLDKKDKISTEINNLVRHLSDDTFVNLSSLLRNL